MSDVAELCKASLIPLAEAVLCANCATISDAKGEECPSCAGRGGLMNLASVLEIVGVVEIQRIESKGGA